MRKFMILTLYLFVGCVIVISAFAQKPAKTGGQEMSIDQNKELVQRLFNEVFNQHAISVVDEIYAQNMVDHSAFPGQPPGTEGIKSAINSFFEIITGLDVTIEDVVAEDNKVVTRETWRGRYISSGQPLSGSVIHIFRIHDGRITDEWSRGWDWLEKR